MSSLRARHCSRRCQQGSWHADGLGMTVRGPAGQITRSFFIHTTPTRKANSYFRWSGRWS